MATISFDFYKEKYFSPCENEEKNIIEYIKSATTLEYRDILKKDDRWDVFYHLSPLREDLFKWYPFEKNSQILQIGADFGATTGTLCKNASGVIVTETSKVKAASIAIRYIKQENLEVLAAAISEVKLTKKFDYIIIENLESSISLEIFLKRVLKVLTPNGKLLFDIKSIFSFKYFFEDKIITKDYTADELLILLKASGYKHTNTYCPYNEHTLAQKKYSDLPKPKNIYQDAKVFFADNFLIEASITPNTLAINAFDSYEKVTKDKYISFLQSKLVNYSKIISDQSEEIKAVKKTFCWKISKPLHLKEKNAAKNKCISKIKNAICLIASNGVVNTYKKLMSPRNIKKAYNEYIKVNIISSQQFEYERKLEFKNAVKFSIVCPLYNTPNDYLTELIDSILAQSYTKFEICFADGSDKENDILQIINSYDDSRILYKKLEKNGGISYNTNEAIKMTTGEYICFIDHDDKLDHTALFEYMKIINNTKADFIYCDEDKFIENNDKYFDPNFKPDFFIDNLRANNYICHFTVFARELLCETGFLSSDYDGSQDHDFVLKLAEKAHRIEHIQKILYHWRVSETSVAKDPSAKNYTILAGQKAVLAHLNRMNISAKIKSSPAHPNIYNITYDIIKTPNVSIIVRSSGDMKALELCIESIFANANYENYNILIIGKKEVNYGAILKKSKNIELVSTQNPINYGEYIVFIKENVAINENNFIVQMLQFAQREDVAAVAIKGYDKNGNLIAPPFSKGTCNDEKAKYIYTLLDNSEYGYFGRMCYTFNINYIEKNCFMVKKELFLRLDSGVVEISRQIRKQGLICYNPNCSYKLL